MRDEDVNRLIEQAIRARGEKPLVKSYAGGKPNYCTPEEVHETPPCKTDPDAPHGFDRNASHSADRYVCECESWKPVDAVNMSQERVDETAKSEQEPVCFLRETSWSYEIAPWDDPNGIPVYAAPPKQEYEVVAEHPDGTYTTKRIPQRQWVGLTDEEIYDYADKFLYQHGSNYGIRSFGKAIEAKLKEKNGG